MPTSRRSSERLRLLVVVCLVASTASAASIFDFDRWMAQMEKRALSLQKSLDRDDAAAGVDDARELERLYRATEEYFVAMGDAPRAAELSRKGWQDSGAIASRVTARDYDGARVLIRTMMEDCRTCHREFKPLY